MSSKIYGKILPPERHSNIGHTSIFEDAFAECRYYHSVRVEVSKYLYIRTPQLFDSFRAVATHVTGVRVG